jgi:hypothetical protein
MKKSDSIKSLAVALSKAQSEMPIAEMDKVNPFFKSKYATLSSVVKAARPVLTKHGLSVVQLPSTLGTGAPALETIIMHESGEWVAETAPLILSKQDMQQFGASVSYLKRIALSAAVGVVADEDDDGNATHEPKREAKKETKPGPKNYPPKSSYEDLECLYCGAGLSFNGKKYFCSNFKDKSFERHVKPFPADALADYRNYFIEEKEKLMGLKPEGVGLS